MICLYTHIRFLCKYGISEGIHMKLVSEERNWVAEKWWIMGKNDIGSQINIIFSLYNFYTLIRTTYINYAFKTLLKLNLDLTQPPTFYL